MKWDQNKSIFEYKISPVKQAIAVLIVILLTTSIAKLAEVSGIFDPKQYFPWVVTFSFLLFFALANCLLSFSADDPNKYWTYSVLSYAGVAIIGGGIAYFFSGLTLNEAATFRWLFFVFTFGYVILLTIMRAMRKIVNYAQKQDSRIRGEE